MRGAGWYVIEPLRRSEGKRISALGGDRGKYKGLFIQSSRDAGEPSRAPERNAEKKKRKKES